VAKHAFTFLFNQAEFGLGCPINVTDGCAKLLSRFGDEALKARYLDGLTQTDMSKLTQGGQFMTEKEGGSDVGKLTTSAVQEGDHWRLSGEKWFCSNADAEVVMLLARPQGAEDGTRGVGLFLMPRRLDDGSPNHYRIVRLKDKLGTKSMASGEIRLEGAEAYLVGRQDQGLKQMMEQVNLSRLSHGVRAAAMMRRCVNEALAAARGRVAFGRTVADFPLMRRQLMKMLVPAEQALSMAICTADALGRGAVSELRILTGLLKLRACRDNAVVATAAMEARGGNGYIEDWVNPRLIRDAQVGLLWEGTSNINALDVIARAVGKSGAHFALQAMLQNRLNESISLPAVFRLGLGTALDRAIALCERVAAQGQETLARQAATAMYDVASAVLLAWEGSRPGADARRALLSRFVLVHRLSAKDPLAPEEAPWEVPGTAALLATKRLDVAAVAPLLC
jgi:acyl-CoA dehydrogenase